MKSYTLGICEIFAIVIVNMKNCTKHEGKLELPKCLELLELTTCR